MNKSGNIGGIERENVDIYKIYTNQIAEFLRNELGFSIIVDAKKWTGISGGFFTSMLVSISSKNIVHTEKNPNYVDRVLAENAAGIRLDSEVVDKLKEFMYPADMNTVYKKPEIIAKMQDLGVYGKTLQDIIRFSNFTYIKEEDLWSVLIRPERIIKKMLTKTDTNELPGEVRIVGVDELVDSKSLRYTVLTVGDNSEGIPSTDVNIMKALFGQ